MKFYCSLVFLAMTSCVALDAQRTTTAAQKVTTVAKNGTRSVHTREIQISIKRTLRAVKPQKISGTHGSPSLSKAIPAAKNAVAGRGKSHANLLPGYPNATINSQSFGTTAVGGTSNTITLSYPYPQGVTVQNLTFAAGLNGFFGQATCNYPQPCTAPLAFQPVYPGVTTNAVISKDQNGNVIYETFLYATGTAPQFGFDLGDLTEYDDVTNQPNSVAVGPDGNIYVADASQNSVYKIAPDFSSQEKLNIVELGVPGGIAVDGASTIYIADKTNNVIVAYNEANGAQATVTTSALSNPNGVAVDGTGALYIADTGHNRIIVIDNQGTETTLASDISAPTSIAVDGSGDVFYADASNGGEITELPSDGSSFTIGTQLGTLYDLAVDAAGRVYVSTSTGLALIGSDGSSEGFGGPANYGIAVDPAGDVITTQPGNSSVSVTDRSASNFVVYAQVNTTTRAADAISNTGTDPLTLSNITISGTVFTSDPNTGCTVGQTLQPGDVCHLVVDFMPPAAQSYQESYTVTSNSLNVSTTMDVDTLYGNGSGVLTSTTLAIAPNPATPGQSVTLTATVVSSSPGTVAAPTGLVYFQDGTTTLGSTNLTSGGTAQFSTSSLAAGSHSITAEYGGDSLNSPSVSTAQNLTVSAAAALPTNTLLVSTPASPRAGQAVTFSASVMGSTQNSPSPTGTVTVTNNNVTPAATLGTITLSGGSGTFTTSLLTAGSYSVTATYSGDATYAASTSGADTFTVSPAVATVTTLAASPTTVAYKTPVTLTASVATAAGVAVAPGQVIFCDAAATNCNLNLSLGVAQLNSSGSAILRLTPGTIASHGYKAVFAGTVGAMTSSSANQTVTVTGTYPTTTAIAASGSAGSYSLTGTVVGLGALSASPAGSVSFVDTSNANASLGTATLGAGTLAFTEVAPAGSPLATGSVPYDVATGDFNGDGLLDLAVANGAGSTVSVFLGNGDGTFHAQVTYPAGSIPTKIAVADVNGDGFADLLVTDDGGSTGAVDVLLGNGDGTFQAMVAYPCAFPEGLGLMDVNHDGIPDIVTAGSSVSVLIGNGDGSFQAAVAYPAGTDAIFVTEADFNGDGNIDLAVVNEGDGTVSILLGNGDGTFQAQTTYAVGTEPQGIQAADLNGDGILDLAVANTNDNTVSVLLGRGDGTFVAQVTYAVGVNPIGLGIADFNGDGFPDLTVTNTNGETEGVLLGKGDGTFAAQVTYPAGTSPDAVATGDFNGDGLPDIAVTAYDSNTLTILLSQVTQTAATPSTPVTVSGASTTHNVEASYPGDTNFSASASQPTPLAGGSTSPLTTNLLQNPGAELGSLQYWTIGGPGTPTVDTGAFDPGINPHTGSYDFLGHDSASDTLSQTVSIIQQGITATQVDAGTLLAQISFWEQGLSQGDPSDDGSVTVTFLDGNAATISAVNSGAIDSHNGTWTNGTGSYAIPSGTRSITYTMNFVRNSGSDLDAFIDDNSLVIAANSGTAASVTTLMSTPSAPAVGQTVTFSVTVAGATQTTPVPTGTVTLTNNSVTPAVVLGTITLNGGTGTFSTNTLAAGSYSVTATYPGDANYAASASTVDTFTVGAGTTADGTVTTLTLSASTTAYEKPITMTATVTAQSGSVLGVGQIAFCDAAASACNALLNLGVAQLRGARPAIFYLPGGTVGTHQYIAKFLGTTAYLTSTSAPQQATITGIYPTATTIASTGTGGSYSLTGTVVGFGTNALSPTGTVSFLDTSNANASLGTAALGAAALGFTETPAAMSPYNAGAGPYGQATGDFNGDGILDLVVELYDAEGVDIYLGNGDGTFTLSNFFQVGGLPERVLVADLNGDGNLDLIVSNTGSGTIGVLLGNGDGSFQAQVTYQCGSPVGLGVMDINHDGIPDVVAGDYYDNTISVLLGNGDGTLKAAVTYATGSTPQTVAEGDFNGDGNVDVVVGNEGGATAGIFLGNGDGTFQAMVTYAVGNLPQGVQVGDFNNDGKEDLAVSNQGDGTVSVLLGNGDGTFQTQVTYPVGVQPVGLAIADFNGDGIQDITVGNTGQASLTQGVLLGNGDGTFKPQLTFPTGNFPYGVATGDFNGDGIPDIGVSNFNDGTVTILLSQVTQTATATASVTVSGTASTMHAVEASYPGDTNFSASVSQPAILTGGGTTTTAASTITLTIAPAAATVGQSVAFTVSVLGTTQTTPLPTGTVTLMNTSVSPATILGTIALGTTGSGVFSTSTLAAGTYVVTAVYSGDANYAGSTSAAETLVVTAATSTGCPVPGLTSNSLNVSYFTLAESDKDSNYFPINGVSSNYVLPALGSNGLPVYNINATATAGSILAPNDLLVDNEITWWSPQLNNGGPGGISDVVATGTAVVSIPFSNDSFYPPNGAGPNDAGAFQTAVLSGTLFASASGSVSFSISSDDMAFLYLDGQIACDDGGDHGATSVPCTTSTIAAGAHTLQVFYADLTPSGAALDFSVTSSNAAVTASQLGFGTTTLSPAATEPQGTSQAITISDPITYSGPQPTGAVSFVLNGLTYPATCTTAGQPSGQESCSAVVPAATIAALPAAAYPVTGSFAGDCNYVAATAQPLTLTITQPVGLELTSISPAGGVTGSPATTITLTGKNFATADVVQFGTGTLATTFVNATTLTAVVPASFFSAVGSYPVDVTDSASGLTSGRLNFVVSMAPMVVFTGPSTATSDQQPVVTFQLLQPYAVPIDCLLTLTFTPLSPTGFVDPTVQFSSGGTTIAVTIPAGSTATPPVQFQTGTVAGTATVTLTITDTTGDPLTPPNVAPVVVTLPGMVPQITSTAAARAAGMFTVTLEGYSNTREVKTAIFHFTPMPGATLDNPDVTVDVTGIFAQWFGMTASQAYGSSFTYTQPFNINADPATIQSVTVTLVNAVGSSAMEDAQ